ncbi:MAG: helix-turn-helix domain-containing protein [Geodermatophilaceae bacterium]|nr:helix-turn-helix domain-containing protein [Geodermatophilaceae bacterium]
MSTRTTGGSMASGRARGPSSGRSAGDATDEGAPTWVGASGASEVLLGEFVEDLARAAAGAALDPSSLLGYTAQGRTAADNGVPLTAVVDLYLTAARRAWHDLPVVRDAADITQLRSIGGEVLGAVDDAVAAVCEGYSQSRPKAARVEEALRREFVDDLLVGTSDPASLIERAPSLGLRLDGTHVVLVVQGSRRFVDGRAVVRDLEASLLARAAAHPDEPDLLVATKNGQLVCVLPVPDATVGHRLDPIVAQIVARLSQEVTLHWRLAVSRPRSGATGVQVCFEEARAALEMSQRLGLEEPVVRAEDLLVYQVLARDREPLRELLRTVLLPLERARGGAAPLLQTLRIYLGTGGIAVHTAHQMHLSVRAVTYRLKRIRQLTGRDPADPEDRYVLETAMRGALVLGWPARPL